MDFNKPITDLIRARRSIRSYTEENMKPDILKDISRILGIKHDNIFNSHLRFVFIDATDLEPGQIRNLGTYGMITRARYFIAGITRQEDGRGGITDLGYIFEKITERSVLSTEMDWYISKFSSEISARVETSLDSELLSSLSRVKRKKLQAGNTSL